MSDRFFSNIKPIPKPRMTHQGRHDPRQKRFWEYKEGLQWAAKLQKFKPGNALEMTFYMPLPRVQKKDDTRRPGDPHTQKPDIDNLVKGALDSFFEDDSIVYEVRAKKIWANAGAVEIRNLTGGAK